MSIMGNHRRDPICTIYIGNLWNGVTCEDLNSAFSHYGSIISTYVHPSDGYGFVEFENEFEKDRAIAEGDGCFLFGRRIRVQDDTQAFIIKLKRTIYNILEIFVKNIWWILLQIVTNLEKILRFFFSNHRRDPTCTIYIGNLWNGVTREDLNSAFSRYGSIKSTYVHPSSGYGFVEFRNEFEKHRAIAEGDGRILFGRRIRVEDDAQASIVNLKRAIYYIFEIIVKGIWWILLQIVKILRILSPNVTSQIESYVFQIFQSVKIPFMYLNNLLCSD